MYNYIITNQGAAVETAVSVQAHCPVWQNLFMGVNYDSGLGGWVVTLRDPLTQEQADHVGVEAI